MNGGNLLKKDALISITGISKTQEDSDTVELITQGTYYKKNNAYYIAYDETEATGYEGSKTILKICTDGKVIMMRSGARKGEMIIERATRHHCSYDMGFGEVMLGISGKEVKSDLTDNGGDLMFSYSLDVNTSLISENEIRINVKECQN